MVLEKVQVPVYIDSITENPVYFQIKGEYLSYIDSFRENKNASDQFIGGMPVQLQKECLSQLLRTNAQNKLIYALTLKVNGVRNLMFLSKSGIIYFIDRVTNLFYFKRPNGEIVGINPTEQYFLFDGELVFHESTKRWEFLIFDVIFYPDNGKVYNWMSHDYFERSVIINNAINFLPIPDFDITVKQWFWVNIITQTPNIYDYVIKQTNANRKKSKLPALKDDGLILQPFDGKYIPFREWNQYNNVQFKWKPAHQLTVDFKIKINPNNKREWWLLTKTNENYGVKQKDGTKINAIMVPSTYYKENDIVECKLMERSNPQKNIFVALQKRTDKTEGNSYQTIMSTLDAMNNQFELDILKPAILSVLSGKRVIDLLGFYSINKLVLCAIDTVFINSEIEKIKEIYNFYNQKKQFVKLNESESESESESDGYDYLNETEFGSSSKLNLQDLLKTFKNTSKKNLPSYELEFKIYPYIKKGKKENIQKFTYYYFLDFLKNSGMKHVYFPTIDIILSHKKATYRSTYTDTNLQNPIENQVKQLVAEYRAVPTNPEIFPLTFKLTLSTETETSLVVGIKNRVHEKTVYNLIRVKLRDSFYTIDNLWRIDITKVISSIGKSPGMETYEIECEYIGTQGIPFEIFIESMSRVYKTVLYNSNYC